MSIFLNGLLEEAVYMTQPPSFESNDKPLVCRIHKAIYGLKQAPKAWFDRLKGALKQIGFGDCKCNSGLFVYTQQQHVAYLLVYLNDIHDS